ncbi:MAG: hypothetical protein DWH91_04715 [Planctomycetota bacterium]|nr:MAG: hypothetical protein DWH91_04715 [Planctomycetota bacterium]
MEQTFLSAFSGDRFGIGPTETAQKSSIGFHYGDTDKTTAIEPAFVEHNTRRDDHRITEPWSFQDTIINSPPV